MRRELRAGRAEPGYSRAYASLEALALRLETSHPGAAASLREGLPETLTLTRLGVTGPLKAALASTNPVESMIEIVRATQRNVKRWRSGEMALRWKARACSRRSGSFAGSSATATCRDYSPRSSSSDTQARRRL